MFQVQWDYAPQVPDSVRPTQLTGVVGPVQQGYEPEHMSFFVQVTVVKSGTAGGPVAGKTISASSLIIGGHAVALSSKS